jgi:hypothetical protein
MEFTDLLARQLQHLRGEPGGSPVSRPSTAELTALVHELQLAVPSLVSVLLISTGELPVPVPLVLLTPSTRPVTVGASLAVDLAAAPDSSVLLVLQATAPGAFLMLSDHLETQLRIEPLQGTTAPSGVRLDEHLSLPLQAADEVFAAALADLALVNQATGLLIGRGRTPDAAVAHLRRRALSTGTSLPAVSRALLAGHGSSDGPVSEP